jgi:DNA-binding transcriptional ArsR family regulator
MGMHRVSASADVFHVIADPTRRGILDLLTSGERQARELEAPFRISQPAVSKHLAVLRAAGLVSQRQQGRMRIYRLEAARLQEVFDWVRHYEKFWDLKLENLGRYLERRNRKKP